jgi:uncharacterized repeat protein (TIGR03943 family)
VKSGIRSLPYLPIFFALLIGFFLPVKTLSASLRKNTNPSLPMIVIANLDKNTLLKNLGQNTLSYKFADWLLVRNVDGDFSFREGKKVKIVGFIFQSNEDPDNVFFITRYIVSCCVVDAWPSGLAVEEQNWRKSFQEGDWVEVDGIFQTKVMEGEEKLLIITNSIKKVKEPQDPYIDYLYLISN